MIFEVESIRTFQVHNKSVQLPAFRIYAEGELEANIKVSSILLPTSEFDHSWSIEEV